MGPNHALQPTAPGRCGCSQRVSWLPSDQHSAVASLDRACRGPKAAAQHAATDDRRVAVASFRCVARAPLAVERWTVMRHWHASA
jgi:hypothetical protein